jgi:Mrp family chromosome partitioning ATPase
MSGNFKVVRRIELEPEAGGSDNSASVVTSRPIGKPTAHGDKTDAYGKEMFRLVQSIFLQTNGLSTREVVFCGVDDDNGSSSVCLNAGQALAAIGSKSVCLVDANLQSECLSGIVALDRPIPLAEKSSSIRERCVQIHGNLWLAGTDLLTDDHGALISMDEMRRLFAQLKSVFEYVLIDAPGTRVCSDAATLGQVAGAAIIVLEANRTRRRTALKEIESLDSAGVRVLGTVLRNRSFPIPAALYKRL